MYLNATDVEKKSGGASSASVLSKRQIERNLAALNDACQDTYKDLLGYACKMVESQEAAEDIVQQAFANTLTSVKRGAEIKNIGGFLYRCVHNLCVNNTRRKPLVSLGDEPYAVVENLTADLTELSTATSVEIRERWSEVEGAVDQLAPNQRNAFLLAEVRGYRYDEIAQSMNHSTSSVRQLISRARKNIRTIAGTGSDWVGIPIPALQAGLAFARERSLSGQKVLDRIQDKASRALNWLEKVFQGGVEVVLQYGTYIAAGAAIVVLGGISPASPAEQGPSDTGSVAIFTQEPGQVTTLVWGSAIRVRIDAAPWVDGTPTDTGRESNVDHGQSRSSSDSDRRASIAAIENNEDSGGNKAEVPSLELKGQERRQDRRSERRQDRRSERRQDRREDQLGGSRQPTTVEDTQQVTSPVELTGNDGGADTSESFAPDKQPVVSGDSDGRRRAPNRRNDGDNGADTQDDGSGPDSRRQHPR